MQYEFFDIGLVQPAARPAPVASRAVSYMLRIRSAARGIRQAFHLDGCGERHAVRRTRRVLSSPKESACVDTPAWNTAICLTRAAGSIDGFILLVMIAPSYHGGSS